MLKGVDGSFDWRFFREWLTEGELPRVGDSVRTKDALLSRTLADRLRLGVGDRVEMLFVEPASCRAATGSRSRASMLRGWRTWTGRWC